MVGIHHLGAEKSGATRPGQARGASLVTRPFGAPSMEGGRYAERSGGKYR